MSQPMTEQEIAAMNAGRSRGNTTPKTTKRKSDVHDTAGSQSKTDKKKSIADAVSAIKEKAIADGEVLANEIYSEAFLNTLKVKRQQYESVEFSTIQATAQLKTANLLTPKQQLALAGTDEPAIIPCEDWLAWEDEA